MSSALMLGALGLLLLASSGKPAAKAAKPPPPKAPSKPALTEKGRDALPSGKFKVEIGPAKIIATAPSDPTAAAAAAAATQVKVSPTNARPVPGPTPALSIQPQPSPTAALPKGPKPAPAGYDPAKARAGAKALVAHLVKKGPAGYDHKLLATWQKHAGLKPDGLYGPLTRSAAAYHGAKDPPRVFFKGAAGAPTTYVPPGK